VDSSGWGFDWEAMSDRCVKALVLAQQEAEFLKAEHVGTEHVLIGLLAGRSMGTDLLADHGVDVHLARATLEKFRSRSEPALIRRFSWRVRRAVELAFEEAGRAHSPFLTTDHLFVGLLSQDDATAVSILVDLGTPVVELVNRLRAREGDSGETDLPYAAALLDQLRVSDAAVPELEKVSAQAPQGMSLDRFIEVLDELGKALQTAQALFVAARPRLPRLDVPEVAEGDWPVVDEEVYPVSALVRQILTQMVGSGADRVVLSPSDDALHVEYHIDGRADVLEVPPILRTVVPFSVMRLANLNPMEKGREMQGELTFRAGDQSHGLRVNSEPVRRGVRVEITRVTRETISEA